MLNAASSLRDLKSPPVIVSKPYMAIEPDNIASVLMTNGEFVSCGVKITHMKWRLQTITRRKSDD
jgi:hypothetical protein